MLVSGLSTRHVQCTSWFAPQLEASTQLPFYLAHESCFRLTARSNEFQCKPASEVALSMSRSPAVQVVAFTDSSEQFAASLIRLTLIESRLPLCFIATHPGVKYTS